MLPCLGCERPRAVRAGATRRPLCFDCRRSRTSKECHWCHEAKPLDAFAISKGKPGAYCRPCYVERQRATGTGGYASKAVTCPDCGAEREVNACNDSERCKRCYGIAQRHPDYAARGPAAGRKRPPLPMPRLQVFERDEWTCGICHEGIDRTLAWPHDFCAVVDHVYPVASGGPNEPWNLQAAHNICNRVKGDKESAELYDQAMAQAPEEWFAQRAEVLAQSDLGRSILKEPW